MRTSPHTVQEVVIEPSSVQVAGVVTASPAVCPVAGTVVGSTRIVPHTEHLVPSVAPSVVQVAATAGIVSSV